MEIPGLPNLAHLADIGIELLLFSVGLKLKPSSLLRSEVLSVGGSHLLLVTGISALVFLAIGERITGGLVLGVSLAFSSTVCSPLKFWMTATNCRHCMAGVCSTFSFCRKLSQSRCW